MQDEAAFCVRRPTQLSLIVVEDTIHAHIVQYLYPRLVLSQPSVTLLDVVVECLDQVAKDALVFGMDLRCEREQHFVCVRDVLGDLHN